MAILRWVKVVGFRDVERHTLNTVFRLSEGRYALWTPEAASPPHAVLMDCDSYEAGLDLASPNFNTKVKMICVGANPPAQAWRHFERPVDWAVLVRELDNLFSQNEDADTEPGDLGGGQRPFPPGVKTALLLGMTRDERLYLRTRLALAGLTEVDEAATLADARNLLFTRHHTVIILSLELSDADAWTLVDELRIGKNASRSIILVSSAPSWASMERAEKLGCTGLLEIPFKPPQVLEILQKV
jgi:CheY-like chemotaxis protein